MQKFRDYIYCDENRINSCIGQIKELEKVEVSNSHEIGTSVDGGANFKIARVEGGVNEKTLSNYKINTSNLEMFMDWVNNKENAINYDGENLDENKKEELIVLSGIITIPEMSENFEIINSLAMNSDLFDMISITDEDRKTLSLIKQSDNIPILLELDSDYIFSFNIKKEFLKISTDDFFDNIDGNITVVGRIEKIYNTEADVEILDLTKEIFHLNRTIRRKISKDNIKDALIYEKGPLIKITPIIIYK